MTYEALWSRDEATLRRYAHKLERNRDDAEDLLQDAYLRGRHGFQNFRGVAKFTSWMYQVIFTQFIESRRKEARRASIEEPLHSLDKRSAGDTSDMLHVDRFAESESTIGLRLDRQSRLREVFLRLSTSPDVAEAVGRYAFGSTYEDIAADLNIPAGTVRSRIFRGRAMVADLRP